MYISRIDLNIKSLLDWLYPNSRKNKRSPVGSSLLKTALKTAYGDSVEFSYRAPEKSSKYGGMEKEAFFKKIDEIIGRREPVNFPISYEEFYEYSMFKGEHANIRPPERAYEVFCHEGRTKEEMEQEARALVNRYANGENLTLAEDARMSWFVNGAVVSRATSQRRMNNVSVQVAELFAGNGIVLENDEKLSITIAPNMKAAVSGVADEDKKRQIEETLNSDKEILGTFVRLYNSNLCPNFNLMPDSQRYLSGCTGEVLDLLEKYSGTSIKLEDLYMDNDGKIHNLPEPLGEKINKAPDTFPEIDPALSRFDATVCYMKTALAKALSFTQKYGSEALPRYDYYFEYTNGKLNAIVG